MTDGVTCWNFSVLGWMAWIKKKVNDQVSRDFNLPAMLADCFCHTQKAYSGKKCEKMFLHLNFNHNAWFK